jgi:predicted ABC-type ATPase
VSGTADEPPETGPRPHAVIVAGPNGAGKSTLAPKLLAQELGVSLYVNADVIAQGLAGFDPGSVAVRAGRIMLERIAELHREKASFAVESTISGASLNGFVRRLKSSGYRTHLVYLWLPDPAVAVDRVRARVAHGGHGIPEADIRRRFYRSVANFERVYRRTVDFWRVYHGVMTPADPEPRLIAHGEAERVIDIVDADAWAELQRQVEQRSGEG